MSTILETVMPLMCMYLAYCNVLYKYMGFFLLQSKESHGGFGLWEDFDLSKLTKEKSASQTWYT